MIAELFTRQSAFLCVFVMAGMPLAASGEPTLVEFDSGRWDLDGAELVTHLGRQCMRGSAHVKDVDFGNGVIEFDMALSGQRSYPGVRFRIQSPGDCEYFYVRPHRAGIYPDALQYTPVFNGVAGWQLYHGEGMTAGASFEHNKWIGVRLEVHGSQARVFFGGSVNPAMLIRRLKHGVSRGKIGFSSARNGTAHFSNFRFEHREDLKFDTVAKDQTPGGTIADWEISKPFATDQVNRITYPASAGRDAPEWQRVTSEPSGLVNISRTTAKLDVRSSSVYARTVLQRGESADSKLSFGYSDDVSLFLNGRLVFSGVSGYRSRDPSFLGLIGLFDTVPLSLHKGENEILLIVSETFGGWGFMGRTIESSD